MCEFVSTFLHSQKYWKIILTKLDMYLKRKTLQRWQKSLNLLKVNEQISAEDKACARIESANHEIGKQTKTLLTLQKESF